MLKYLKYFAALFLLISGCRSWRCVDCDRIERAERVVKAELARE